MLVGHAAIQAALRNLVVHDKVPHALLFTGPKGVGKRTLAEAFIRHLICGPAHPDDKGLTCNTQHADYPRLEAGAYTALYVLEPTTRKSIVVDDIRPLFEKMSLTQDNWRILLIDSADDLNPSGANLLLKTLEEPNSKTVIILISHQPAAMLPTVVSRCQRYTFNGLNDTDLQQVLRQADTSEISPSTLENLTPLAGGSPGWLISLAEQAGKAPDIIMQFLRGAITADPRRISHTSESLCQTCDNDAVVFGLLLQALQAAARQAQPREAQALARAYQKVNEVFTQRQTYNINRSLSVEKALSEVVWAVQNA